MPMLLEDLAAVTTESYRRVTDRLAAERRSLGTNGGGPAEQAMLRRKTIEAARQATSFAVSLLPAAEAMWRSTLESLREGRSAEDAIRLLKGMLGVFDGGQFLCEIPRDLWTEAVALGATADPNDDLGRTRACFDRLAAEARKAIDHRVRGWQPADPERYARGVKEASEGKAVPADEVIRRFRGN